MLPIIENYGDYASDNYGVNTKLLITTKMNIWYSHDTIVAYKDDVDGLVVRQNDWGPTTGKHLNWIDNKNHKGRLPHQEFIAKLEQAMTRNGL